MLVSESEQICLNPDDRYAGEFRVSQVTLRPERLLTRGKTYAMLINEKSPRVDKWLGDRRSDDALNSLQWTADLPRDDLPPMWFDDPELIKAEVTEYGCGPAIGAEVKVRVHDENPTMLLATIFDPGASTRRSYLLHLTNDAVFVGHGMCSGGFDLAPGAEYQVSFDIIDVAGNSAESFPKEVQFKIPNRRRQ
jgi:hypothetical protein